MATLMARASSSGCAATERAGEEGRTPVCEGDIRARYRHVGKATQHRVFATLRNALNVAWKTRRVDQNVCHFVELPPETLEPARVWSPEQVGEFVARTEGDRLHLLWRLVLLRGLRRGEVIGLRWADLEHRKLRVTAPILQIAGKVVTGQPKSRAGERVVVLDPGATADLKSHRKERMKFAGCTTTATSCCSSAEGVGFEPTKRIAPLTGFQDQRHRPLGEPSRATVVGGTTVHGRA